MSKTEHPYAQVLRWIADGETVEYQCSGYEFDAEPVRSLLCRIADKAPIKRFRLKPRTININGHEVPEPMRVAPAKGDAYFVPGMGMSTFAGSNRWDGHTLDEQLLARGLCHATREAAEAHARALLSFTTTEAA